MPSFSSCRPRYVSRILQFTASSPLAPVGWASDNARPVGWTTASCQLDGLRSLLREKESSWMDKQPRPLDLIAHGAIVC